ncbi:IucA/IucC family C-terminal-domain containing protein [Tumebacillus flagellatus]|uniref:Aerobactin siderophore biosynthesis IucA/IucC-like C-terminal domain-containing protein n=1 Tax=Tumebacillus flagellatus TaxID=1157490 RepID=A0A074LI23_9BACL|nr:IucA/IucC family C-terminal-domain containing protein [Tumebacillus flagellatus]KEO81881.1 hypothetical protein EL26_18765 [Tumebacillus flagellatus]
MTTISVCDLLEGPHLRHHIESIARRLGTDDLAAAASLFQKRYCGKLLSSVLNPLTRLRVGILAPAEALDIVLEDDLPAEVVLHAPQTRMVNLHDAQEEDRLRSEVFRALFDDNLGRLSMRIASEIGVSLRVLWGNIGNYGCWLYEDVLLQDPDLQDRARRDFEALMACPGMDKTPPLACSCQKVFVEDAEPPRWARVRQTCCLAYKFEGRTPCYTCPRLSMAQRAELLPKPIPAP